MDESTKSLIREKLTRRLAERGLLWSYDTSQIKKIPDRLLVEKVFIYGDLIELAALPYLFTTEFLKSQIDLVFTNPRLQQSKNFVLSYLFGIQ